MSANGVKVGPLTKKADILTQVIEHKARRAAPLGKPFPNLEPKIGFELV